MMNFFFTKIYLATKSGLCHKNFMKNRILSSIFRPCLSEKCNFLLIDFWQKNIFKKIIFSLYDGGLGSNLAQRIFLSYLSFAIMTFFDWIFFQGTLLSNPDTKPVSRKPKHGSNLTKIFFSDSWQNSALLPRRRILKSPQNPQIDPP